MSCSVFVLLVLVSADESATVDAFDIVGDGGGVAGVMMMMAISTGLVAVLEDLRGVGFRVREVRDDMVLFREAIVRR